MSTSHSSTHRQELITIMSNEKLLPFIEHLVDLRKRLIVIIVAVTLGMGVAWNFSPAMLTFIEKPLTGQTYLTELKAGIYGTMEKRYPDFFRRYDFAKETAPKEHNRQLNYTAPLEPFFIQCKLSVMAGFILALPLVFHQVWMFVSPGLRQKEKRLVIPFVVSATLAFCAGAAFFLWVIWPVIINFSLSYESEGLQSWFSLSAYVNFCLRLIFIFGLIFELPVAAMLLSRFGLINGRLLAKNRKYALLASTIVSAFHADLLTMFVVMIPLYLMYEISVWVAFIFGKKRQSASDVTDAVAILSQPSS